MSVKEADRVLPATSGERAATRERRSVVKSSRVKQYEPAVIGALSVLAALTAWQLVANARIWPPLFLPGPWEVGQAMVKLFQQGDIWLDMATSGQEIAIGYGLAMVIGLAVVVVVVIFLLKLVL